ncbi:hypothetical protein D3C85_1555350 [compost metagenome]
MTLMISTIFCALWLMASIFFIISRICSSPSLAIPAAFCTICDACSALSVFCFTVAVICSMLAAVSTTAAACSSVRRERSPLPDDISCVPILMDSTPWRIETTVEFSSACMVCNAPNSIPISFLLATWISPVRSPLPIYSKC